MGWDGSGSGSGGKVRRFFWFVFEPCLKLAG